MPVPSREDRVAAESLFANALQGRRDIRESLDEPPLIRVQHKKFMTVLFNKLTLYNRLMKQKSDPRAALPILTFSETAAATQCVWTVGQVVARLSSNQAIHLIHKLPQMHGLA